MEHRIQEKISSRSCPLDKKGGGHNKRHNPCREEIQEAEDGKGVLLPEGIRSRTSDIPAEPGASHLGARRSEETYYPKESPELWFSCPLLLTQDQVRWQATRARDKYTQLKRNLYWNREQYFILLASSLISDEKAKAIKMKLRNKKVRREWQTIILASRKTRSKLILTVAVLKGNKSVNTVGKEVTEKAILNSLVQKFGRLTEGTPLMEGPLALALRPVCENEEMHSVLLEGGVGIPGIDENFELMLSILSGHFYQNALDGSISREDYVQFWKGADERTSLSPSIGHFGHYKAAVGFPTLENVYAPTCHTACSSGIPLEGWKRRFNCMLEKKEGKIRLDKLRAILLMEADFNFSDKLIFCSRILEQAEKHHALPNENAGSRNRRSYIKVAPKRGPVGNRLRLLNRPGCIIPADAHTCYDQIVHKFAILVCMSLGVTYAPLKVMFKAIAEMKYAVRTSFRDSTASVSGSLDNPVQGICRGNRARPAIWLVISLMLVQFMHKAGKVRHVMSSISGVVTAIMGFMFVDGTNLMILEESGKCWRTC